MSFHRHQPIRIASRRGCDHDGRATGRLVIDGATVRREIACERCGRTLYVLGREPYTPKALAPVAA
jgi:hypothetical protein